MPRKQVLSKRSQRFSELARVHWSKVKEPQDEPRDDPRDEPHEYHGHVATVTSLSVNSSTRNKAVESSASVISGCLSDSDEHLVSDEQITEETVVDETESTVTVESIID